ncbi:MAG: hypothetical protein ISR82_06375 [Candidatus Marinimicrobia bacterium]|nr:hypothetical protein [Candidatus Neomarinimicrobiota bacterium]MBL7010830.1 hypothetical protein [Candidatus Neomarinimicrobiota bacterium]MBL7030122.1 hypothetical protein [Candidatus Neomarinimicrobiota bacterium]
MPDNFHIEQIFNDQNYKGVPAFEGYSPVEIHAILYETFNQSSPIQLNTLTESDYKKIPLLNQIKFLIEIVDSQGELKLTSKGYLPPKIVKNLYNQGFLKDYFIDSGISKLSKELDSVIVTLSRILLEISGIVKKRKNKLSLTKKGKKLSKNNYKLLKHIFSVFGSKFNWSYFDLFGEDNIGQMGFGFTLILLSKYGNNKQLDTFYADKYFNAFPMLINYSIKSSYETPESHAFDSYSIRSFDRFLDYFGLINIEQEKKWDADKYISKTDLFDSLISCTPHIHIDSFRDIRA